MRNPEYLKCHSVIFTPAVVQFLISCWSNSFPKGPLAREHCRRRSHSHCEVGGEPHSRIKLLYGIERSVALSPLVPDEQGYHSRPRWTAFVIAGTASWFGSCYRDWDGSFCAHNYSCKRNVPKRQNDTWHLAIWHKEVRQEWIMSYRSQA